MKSAKFSRAKMGGLLALSTMVFMGCSVQTPQIDPNRHYLDGSYLANGSYLTPAGTESITVELTLSQNLITEIEVASLAKHGTSKINQAKFISGIANEVLGKHIDSLAVTRVAGSSLTSGGFKEALERIKAEALR